MSPAGWPSCIVRAVLWAILLLAWFVGRLTGATNELVDIRRDFHVRQWTTEHGLPDDRIHCLLQTRDGYLWIGTENGLVRFDGLRFTVFNRANTPALEENHINGLAEDTDGTLWINGDRAHLANLRRSDFSQATTAKGRRLLGHTPTAAPRGGVWAALENQLTLTRWREGVSEEVVPLAAGAVVAVAEMPDGGLWVVEPGSLRFRAAPGAELRQFPIAQPVSFYDISCALAQRGNALWLFYGNTRQPSHLFRLEPERLVAVADNLPQNDIRSMFLVAARDDSFWLPLSGRGLLNLRGTNQVPYSLPWSRPQDHALCALEDREGNLWVGSEYSGLFRLRPRAVQVIGAAEGLPHENIRCVLANEAGQVWAGTDQGLARLTPENGSGMAAERGRSRPRGLTAGNEDHEAARARHADVTVRTPAVPGQTRVEVIPSPAVDEFSVRALAHTPGVGLEVGTSRGLYRLRDGQFHLQPLPVVHYELGPQFVASLKLRDLLTDSAGNRWAAAPCVLSVLPPAETVPRTIAIFGRGVPPNALREDHAGNLWMATDGYGVGVLPAASLVHFLAQPAKFASTNLPTHPFGPPSHVTAFAIPDIAWLATTNGLPSNHAWELYEARDGAMWIATEMGVVRLPPNPALRTPHSAFVFTSAHGLPDHQVNSIIEDDHGHVWFGTDTGIFHVPHAELLAVAEGRTHRVHATPYGEADGLLSPETNGRISHPGVCKTPDGRLWFATTKGVAVFDPTRLHAVEEVPPLAALEEVIADGELIFTHARSGADAVKSEVGSRKPERTAIPHLPSSIHLPLRLPPGRGRVLEFHFTGLNFAAPDQCRFQYRLDGYDTPGEWHDGDTRRVAYYTNLDPGDYRFEVLVRNHRNLSAESPAIFAFSLAPFVWQTGWFWTAVSLAVARGVTGLVAWRLRVKDHIHRLETQRLAAEEQLKREQELARERQRLARNLHDDVGASLVQLKALVESAKGSDDGSKQNARESIRRLDESICEANRVLRETLWAVHPADDTVAGLADRLCRYAEEYLGHTGVRVRFDVPVELPPVALTPEQRREFLSAFKEVLTNTVKHARASEVRLQIEATPDGFRAVVSDNGQGFDPSNAKPAAGDGGRGLGNIRARLAALGGKAEITSSPGHGTQVTLEMPIGK